MLTTYDGLTRSRTVFSHPVMRLNSNRVVHLAITQLSIH